MGYKQKIEQYLEREKQNQLDFLAQLVQCPSDNPPGNCTPHAELTAKKLEELGFTVERHQVPDEVVKACEMQGVTNLVIREKFGPGPTIVLNAHGDVVPPGDGWSTDPYGAEIIDGWLYGRGAAVSKSDFATYTYALKALKEHAENLNGTVEIHFTYDEETGGLAGPGWLLEQKISQPDYAICPGFSYDVTIAHNGCLHLEVTVHGRSAHAAMPDTGHDALKATNKLLTALYEYSENLKSTQSKITGISSPTMVVGLIEGGINTNVVPDKITLRIDRRIIPEENAQQVENELKKLIEGTLATEDGINVDIKQILLAKPLLPTEKSKKLAQQIAQEAKLILDEEQIPLLGVPLYTDARLYAEHGIPTVMYGAGPKNILDANGHRADEKVPVDLLPKVSLVIALTIKKLLGGQTQENSEKAR